MNRSSAASSGVNNGISWHWQCENKQHQRLISALISMASAAQCGISVIGISWRNGNNPANIMWRQLNIKASQRMAKISENAASVIEAAQLFSGNQKESQYERK